MINKLKIQKKWKNSFVLGYDCIVYGNGKVTIGNYYSLFDPNNKKIKYYWSPICDTTLDKIEKYDDDIWTEIGVFHGDFEYENQNIVFGDGGMGNEGYIASTNLNGELNWSIFFTFSNPIYKAKIIGNHLICFGDTGTQISISLKELHKIKINNTTKM